MHELSLALEVVNLVSEEAEKNKVTRILELEMEIGELSGVEAEIFRSALGLVSGDTLLEHAGIRINAIPGKGYCKGCDREFAMHERLAVCPECSSFPSSVEGGEEFRIVSILAE